MLGLLAFASTAALFLLTLPIVAALFPFVESGEAGFSPDRQLAYGQLLVAFVGIGVASGLGFVAVQQLIAARQAVDQEAEALKDERRARADTAESQAREVLSALYIELNQNRLIAFFYEQRVEFTRPIRPYGSTPGFNRRVFDQVMGGPLWAISDFGTGLAAVAAAYDKMIELNAILAVRRWLPIPLAGGLVALGRGADQDGAGVRWSLFVLTGVIGLVGIVGTHSYVFVSGMATEARVAIEAAMEAVYCRIGPEGGQLDWEQVDSSSPAPRARIVAVRQPAALERVLAKVGLWLAETFGL